MKRVFFLIGKSFKDKQREIVGNLKREGYTSKDLALVVETSKNPKQAAQQCSRHGADIVIYVGVKGHVLPDYSKEIAKYFNPKNPAPIQIAIDTIHPNLSLEGMSAIQSVQSIDGICAAIKVSLDKSVAA